VAFAVEARDVSVAFGSQQAPLPVLDRFTLSILPGEFVAIIGPSGCGKSTFLNAITAQVPYTGTLLVSGQAVGDNPPPDVGYLFQRDHLLPWRSVIRNTQLPLEFRGMPLQQRTAAARAALTKVGLGDFAGYYPHQLSGGMLKRAALAQVLCYRPKLLLMDEPFGALDAQTRTLLETEFYSLWLETRQTVLFVTHDLTEAVSLAQRVIVMSARPGRIIGDFRVDLPVERNIAEVRFSAPVRDLEMQIWELLRREVTLAQRAPEVAKGG
jgi:NitT/TauT family transport system ATP-binding protein